MNDVETLLTDHLRTKAAAVRPTDRLRQVHAGRGSGALPGRRNAGTDRRRRFVVRPAWLGVAAGTVAAAGAGTVVLVDRSSQPPSPTVPPGALPVTPGPTVNDHWHEAYGFWLCDEWVTLNGAAENPVNDAYVRSGLHSHDDGVIHIHPFTSAGTGENATLGTFLTVYGVELSDDALRFPADQGGDMALTCDGAPAALSVTVWPDADSSAARATVTSDLAGIRLLDGAAMTIAIATPGASIPMPPSAPDLDALAVVDGGGLSDGEG